MNKLLELRKIENKTQIALAKYLGITQTSYRRYETGEADPNVDSLIKLADYYHVTIDYLVGRSFTYDVGNITESEKLLLSNYRALTEVNKKTLIAESSGMLLVQNS